jgi:hypothetical protein
MVSVDVFIKFENPESGSVGNEYIGRLEGEPRPRAPGTGITQE